MQATKERSRIEREALERVTAMVQEILRRGDGVADRNQIGAEFFDRIGALRADLEREYALDRDVADAAVGDALATARRLLRARLSAEPIEPTSRSG